MPNDVFGQAIAKAKADGLFKRYIEIKRRSLPKIKKALKDDPEALRYYCGRPGAADPVCEDWAFVFDKASLQRIMEKMEKLDASGVFVFHGAKSAKDSVKGGKGRPTDTAGAPTLMIFPASYYAAGAAADVEFTIHAGGKKAASKKGAKAVGKGAAADDAGEDFGEQHPGTGGGTLSAKGPVRLPDSFTKGQYR